MEEEQGEGKGKKQSSKFRNIVYLEAPYMASVFLNVQPWNDLWHFSAGLYTYTYVLRKELGPLINGCTK